MVAVILIDVVINGESGFIVAVETQDRDPGAGQYWDGISSAFVVGQARVTADGAKAWLWPYAGTYPGRGRHVHAVTAGTASDLAGKLRKRFDEKGKWWQ